MRTQARLANFEQGAPTTLSTNWLPKSIFGGTATPTRSRASIDSVTTTDHASPIELYLATPVSGGIEEFANVVRSGHEVDEVADAADGLHRFLLQAKFRDAAHVALADIARDRTAPCSSRETALETLVGATQPEFERSISSLITVFLSGSSSMQVSGIACAGILSRSTRQALRQSIAPLASSSTKDVRRAAEAFLRESA